MSLVAQPEQGICVTLRLLYKLLVLCLINQISSISKTQLHWYMVYIFIITLYTKVKKKKKVAPAARKKARAGARGNEEANVFP